MRSVKSLIAAAAASLLSTMACAGDLAIAPPPMSYAPPAAEFEGWYLRGDIGLSNQSVNKVLSTDSSASNNIAVSQTRRFAIAGVYDLGVGYQFNNWFRADFTAQYRGKSRFTGLDVVTGTGPLAGLVGTDNYTATKSEFLFLANAYLDLGTWWDVTPFIGAGIGSARVSIANFTDTGDFIVPGVGQVHSFNFAGEASKWNFAWAAHAGLAYRVSPGLTLELAYNFVSLGSGSTGATFSSDQVTNTAHAAFAFRNIYSNDVMVGMRWNLSQPAYAPPLVTKG